MSSKHEHDPRNSPLREFTSKPALKIAEFLHRKFPHLTANHLTAVSVIGVIAGSYIAQRNNRREVVDANSLTPLIVLTTASLLDRLDGELARVRGEASFIGQLVDASSDRIQESAMALSRAASAHKRGDKLGEFTAYAAGVTNGIPSTARALNESFGAVVKETGSNKLQFFGTRAGRAIVAIAETVYPQVRGVPVQVLLDAFTVAMNSYIAYDRILNLSKKTTDKSALSWDARKEGIARALTMSFFVGATLGATLVTYQRLRKPTVALESSAK